MRIASAGLALLFLSVLMVDGTVTAVSAKAQSPAARAAPSAPPLPSSARPAPAEAGDAAKTKAADTTAAPATPEKVKPVPVRPTLHATINLTTQRMTVVSNGRRLHHWPISSGRSGYETPTGRFRPGWMAKRWHSRKYDMAPMPYSVFFNDGIATHGTSAVSRLGRPASHGCVRLHTANARRFYNLVRRHGMKRTRIVVTGHARQRRRRPTRSVYGYRSLGVYGNRGAVVRYKPRSYYRTPAYRPYRRTYRAPRRRAYSSGVRY